MRSLMTSPFFVPSAFSFVRAVAAGVALSASLPLSLSLSLARSLARCCGRSTMASDFKTIPVIDISPLLEKCDEPNLEEDPSVLEVVRLLDQACKEAGFFYVTGHGVSDSLIKQVKDVTHKFFELPIDEKVRIKMSSTTGFRGYQRIAENITKGRPDMHEAIDCYREVGPGMYGKLGQTMEGSNPWPENPSNFKELMEKYISLLLDLSRKIMRGIALALGGPVDAFEGERAGDPFWVMRLIGYPGSSDAEDNQMQDNDIGCGAHTDYGKKTFESGISLTLGLLTLVNQDDDITALQVRNLSGEWINAMPIPGTFVCNIGDMLKVLSNGLYEPTLHRVINNSSKYRTSIAFFYETRGSCEPISPGRKGKDVDWRTPRGLPHTQKHFTKPRTR